MIAFGFALPGVAYLVARVAMSVIAANARAPDQGAMVVAFLGTVASVGVGLLIIATGTYILVRSYRGP